MKSLKTTVLYIFIACSLQMAALSCTTVDLYEKTTVIPGHKWQNSFKPTFTFTIKDTTSNYQLFLILRHTEKYSFNNIYINITAKVPGQDFLLKGQWDLPLATNEAGWLATGMDDIYEHRIELGKPGRFRTGDYTYTLEQIMREDPLNHVLDVGLRIEKK